MTRASRTKVDILDSMASQVDASTVSAGTLFSTNTFQVPDFQREYSWTVENQVKDFWRDLSEGISKPPYFLGLIILTGEEPRTIIDGQQRLITMSLLANALRITAELEENELVAATMRDMFLFAPNYETKTREPRVSLTSNSDNTTFAAMLKLNPGDVPQGLSPIEKAQRYLLTMVKEDENGLGSWATYLTSGIQFAQFLHPTVNAAFKVYEVVNTRGKDLTPAELLKSYMIGSASESDRKDVYTRWDSLEQRLGSSAALTNFVRHAITLETGYVLPRDLYETVTKNYPTTERVTHLLEYLEKQVSHYAAILDPWGDSEDEDHAARSLIILDRLGLRTVRPLFLALLNLQADRSHYERAMKIIIPRLIGGQFGTGAVERAFAIAARAIYQGTSTEEAWVRLEEFKPEQEEFERKVQEAAHNKGALHVLRACCLQDSILPELDNSLHLIRPRNADWPEFSKEDFRILGNTIGNSILTTSERRPHGTNTLEGVVSKLLPLKLEIEIVDFDLQNPWSIEDVRDVNQGIATTAGRIFYEHA